MVQKSTLFAAKWRISSLTQTHWFSLDLDSEVLYRKTFYNNRHQGDTYFCAFHDNFYLFCQLDSNPVYSIRPTSF